MLYLDPQETPSILLRLNSLPTVKEIKELVCETFPTWIITVLPAYSPDYPQLTCNWGILAKMNNSVPAEIIIIDEMVFDENHTLIRTFAELFTCSGYVVRRKSELLPCSNCGKAIPNENIYNQMKEKNINVPETWSSSCIKC
jgi:hypothetical protein